MRLPYYNMQEEITATSAAREDRREQKTAAGGKSE